MHTWYRWASRGRAHLIFTKLAPSRLLPQLAISAYIIGGAAAERPKPREKTDECWRHRPVATSPHTVVTSTSGEHLSTCRSEHLHQPKIASAMDNAIAVDAVVDAPAPAPTPTPATIENPANTDTTITIGNEAAAAAVVPAAVPAAADGVGIAVEEEGAPIALPMSGGVDHTKTNAEREACDIQDGCQSSAERNIWSVFNPMWNIFVVPKPRLPKPSDRGADWAGTVGRPDELNGFFGLKNPINRK